MFTNHSASLGLSEPARSGNLRSHAYCSLNIISPEIRSLREGTPAFVPEISATFEAARTETKRAFHIDVSAMTTVASGVFVYSGISLNEIGAVDERKARARRREDLGKIGRTTLQELNFEPPTWRKLHRWGCFPDERMDNQGSVSPRLGVIELEPCHAVCQL